jgi:hypothetical protein
MSPAIFSQEVVEKKGGTFGKLSFATTLRINEDYRIRIFGEKYEEDKALIQLSAYFLNASIGHQFENRAALAINLEYNYHSRQGLHFLMPYLSGRLNIVNKPTTPFIRGGYGGLFDISNNFKEGNMYKLGLGFMFDNAFLFGFEFTNKTFGYRSLTALSSVSIFIEFMIL